MLWLCGKVFILKRTEQKQQNGVTIPKSRRPPALGRDRLSQKLVAVLVGVMSMRSELSLLTCPGHRAGRSLLAQEGARGCEITTWRAFSLLVMAAPWWFSPCRCQCIWSGSLTCIIITTGTRLKSQELECMCKALFYTSLFTWGLINEYLVPLIHN